MKSLFSLALAFALNACSARPYVSEVNPSGTKTTIFLGGAVAADNLNVLASVETPSGWKINYAAKKEEATSVPNTLIYWKGMKWLTDAMGITRRAEIAADRDVAIGAQNADVAKFGIDKGAKTGVTNTAIGAGAPLGQVNVTPP